MELFKLFGKIAVENDEANEALDKTSEKGEATESKLKSAFSKIGSAAVTVGKTMATGLAAGAAAMGTLTVKALNLSGELEQNMGGSEAVFKEYATKMQDTAKNAFENMGLSTSSFLATANKMGALFQGSGFSIQESAEMSSQAMQRAADVASIMGIDVESAMEAVAGAAKGNFEMMDNLGVAMNDTTLGTYALSKGIEKSTSDMTTQEKVGLAMQMFLEKTTYATGNYAKENETLSGSLGTAKSALTNFLDGSGNAEQLVTSFSNAANVIVENVNTILPRLVEGMSQALTNMLPLIPPLLQQLLPGILTGATMLIQAVVSALPAILSLIMNILPDILSAMIEIFNQLVAALPQLVQILITALTGDLLPNLINGLVSMILTLIGIIPQIIQPIIDNLPTILTILVNALLSNLPALVDGLTQLITALAAVLPQLINTIIDVLPGLIITIGSALIECLPTILESVGQMIAGIGTSLWESISAFPAEILAWLGDLLQPLFDKVSEVWENIKNAVKLGFEFIGSLFSAAWQIITLPFRFVWENCKEYVFEAFEWIKEKIQAAFDKVKEIFTTVWTAIKNVFEPIINGIKETVSNVFNKIKETVENVINKVKEKVTTVFTKIKTAISEPLEKAKAKVTEIFDGIKTKIDDVIGKAKDIVDKGIQAIKGFFDKLKLKFPDIKLPHFSIEGKFSLSPVSVPKLSIKWYKDAMDNAMLLNSPTIFGMNPNGGLLGGGEAGQEVVAGSSTLMNMIKSVVQSENSGIAYYLEKLISMLAAYFPELLENLEKEIVLDGETLVGKLAPKMDSKLGDINKLRARGI